MGEGRGGSFVSFLLFNGALQLPPANPKSQIRRSRPPRHSPEPILPAEASWLPKVAPKEHFCSSPTGSSFPPPFLPSPSFYSSSSSAKRDLCTHKLDSNSHCRFGRRKVTGGGGEGGGLGDGSSKQRAESRHGGRGKSKKG